MILDGWVDDQLSPRIKLFSGIGTEIEVVVDTGFNGELVLPKHHFRN
jgi:predicted aspartyl protease